MKKLYTLIFLIILSSCTSNKIIDLEEADCNCKIITYQVTPQGNEIERGSTDIKAKCSEDGYVFDRKYSGTMIIHYSIYKCY